MADLDYNTPFGVEHYNKMQSFLGRQGYQLVIIEAKDPKNRLYIGGGIIQENLNQNLS